MVDIRLDQDNHDGKWLTSGLFKITSVVDIRLVKDNLSGMWLTSGLFKTTTMVSG